jgi:hypothetical protein
MGATSCSGDSTDAAEANALRPTFQGSPVGAAGSGGAGAGGSAVAGAGPGSAGAGPGSAGAGDSSANAGAPGAAGVAGSADSGGSGAPPEAGPNAPPPEPADEEPPLPIPTDVEFSDVLPILSGNCTPCHATAGSQLPAFAQDDADASYEVTQAPSNFADQLISDRIVERSVVELTMPPGCFGDLGSEGCLSERDAALLEAWIDQGAPP